MKKLVFWFIILISNLANSQSNAVIIKKLIGDNLLFPVVFCNDSIGADFSNKYLTFAGFTEGLSPKVISCQILDTLSLDTLSQNLRKQLDSFVEFNNKDSLTRYGLFEIIYIKNSKVRSRDTLYHYNNLEFVLYQTAINLHHNKNLYDVFSYQIIKFLFFNTRPFLVYPKQNTE